MNEQKFNNGDLVETLYGTRLFVMSSDSTLTKLAIYNDDDDKYCIETLTKELKLIKPAKQYITVNGHKVPKPLSEMPKDEPYYIADIIESDLYVELFWDDCDDENERRQINLGLCFDNKEGAITMSKALLSAIPKD